VSPNRNYVAGVAKERLTVNWYKARGWHAQRTAGSHSLIDVIAWEPGGTVHLCQIKRTKDGAWKDANWHRLMACMPMQGRTYAFVYRHGSTVPMIYDATGPCEWRP
jgi:hypothetical protein